VKTLSPEDGHTLISLYAISYLFARDLIWDENNSYTTIEECIADTIDNEFINLSDTEYDTPYITVSYTTATPFIMPDTENGLWNLKAYIAKVRRVKNVFLDYTISRNDLLINIEQRTPNVWRFDFATDAAQMSQETYQKTSTAKITVNGATDYYLYADGTYGNDPDLKDRAEGDWVQLQVSQNESEADKVADVFSKNSESRIIEFYTDAPVEFYDSVILRHEGRVTSGTLSTVSISSSDNRRYCKTGDLINTVPEAISVLSERIEKVTKTVERATESQNIQGDFHVSGDIYEGGVKLEDKYPPFPTEYVSDLTWTDWANTKTLTWTVHGSGFVYVSASTRSANNNDTATAYAEILLNGNLVAVELNRLSSAATLRLSANASVMMNVSDGDVITVNLNNSKGGTAEGYRRALAFGCTLT
jgi:hypothetical protein